MEASLQLRGFFSQLGENYEVYEELGLRGSSPS
jgi:hypothetical protein